MNLFTSVVEMVFPSKLEIPGKLLVSQQEREDGFNLTGSGKLLTLYCSKLKWSLQSHVTRDYSYHQYAKDKVPIGF